jgi:hypothetical protein
MGGYYPRKTNPGVQGDSLDSGLYIGRDLDLVRNPKQINILSKVLCGVETGLCPMPMDCNVQHATCNTNMKCVFFLR